MDHDPLSGWRPHFALGVTGHRPGNAAFTANAQAVEATLAAIFERIDARAKQTSGNPKAHVRLHTLLALGVDLLAAGQAARRGWLLVAPLPFGAGLNLAINAGARSRADIEALGQGRAASDAGVERAAKSIRDALDTAHRFEIADRDEEITALFQASLDHPSDAEARREFDGAVSENAAMAGQIMVEQSDLLIAVWDRQNVNQPGSTGHTVLAALAGNTPVLLIDAAQPANWSILTSAEELGHLPPDTGANPGANTGGDTGGGTGTEADACTSTNVAALDALVDAALTATRASAKAIAKEKWRSKSAFGFGIYRRIEQLFGGRTTKSGTVQSVYEAPDSIAQGSAAPFLNSAQSLLKDDDSVIIKLRDRVLPSFAWADGVSSRLADAYRSGMSVNFLLSALAIIAGVAYLPLGLASHKWIFAAVELMLLLAIVFTTYAGSKRAWHRRWFETRRLAEYLRFGPVLAVLGIARAAERWPLATRDSAEGHDDLWPERLSRDILRDVGLPAATINKGYLHTVLSEIALPYAQAQRRYHTAKSAQLARAHHRIDRAAEMCFLAAVVSVSIYLMAELGALLALLPADWPYAIAKAFTFLGVAFPTVGANLAGIRYFGDFERFSSISEATAARLETVEKRIEMVLQGDASRLTFKTANELVQTIDEIIVSEIENWQSVFRDKPFALPA